MKHFGLSEPLLPISAIAPKPYRPDQPRVSRSLPLTLDGRRVGRLVITERGCCYLRGVSGTKLADIEWHVFGTIQELGEAIRERWPG